MLRHIFYTTMILCILTACSAWEEDKDNDQQVSQRTSLDGFWIDPNFMALEIQDSNVTLWFCNETQYEEEEQSTISENRFFLEAFNRENQILTIENDRLITMENGVIFGYDYADHLPDNCDESKRDSSMNASEEGYTQPTEEEYVGLWYDTERDWYLRLSSDTAEFLECTLDDGYVAPHGNEYTIKEGEIVVDDDTTLPILFKEDHILISTNLLFYQADSLPEECDGDAIKIVEHSPSEIDPNQENTFKMTLRFRLKRLTKAQIEIGWGTDSGYSPVHTVVVDQADESIEVELTATLKRYANSGENLFTFVQIAEYAHYHSWTPLAVDSLPIQVTSQPSSRTKNSDTRTLESTCHSISCKF